MSLPVFTATSFQGILKGGRNNPWLIIVDKEGTPTPYVVKLFNSNGFDSDKFTINEVLGSFLASEFDLPVPSAALIEMDEFFKRTIHDEKAFQQFELSDERIKFGCMELKGFYNFNPKAINCADAKRAIDIDTVFAFDNFIRNPDRGYIKPNLLIKKDSAFLIDHELGFDIDASTFDNMMGQKWEPRFFEKHIFYSYLMESRKGNKENHFIAFA